MLTSLPLWQEGILLLVGIAAGYINVMAGGGSLLTLPTMIFLGLPAPIANGTNRIAVIAQCLTAATVFYRKGLSELRLSFTLALFTLPGAVLGAWLGVHLTGVWFNRLLAVVMVLAIIFMLKPTTKPAATTVTKCSRQRLWLGHLLMLGIGFYGGIIQVGVGLLMMPILHRVLGMDLLRVNMHKVFLVIPFTLVSLIIFSSQLTLNWWAGLALGLGNAIGGWFATHAMIRHGEKWIKRVFVVVVIVMVIKLLS